jgi:hypothetical protein
MRSLELAGCKAGWAAESTTRHTTGCLLPLRRPLCNFTVQKKKPAENGEGHAKNAYYADENPKNQ